MTEEYRNWSAPLRPPAPLSVGQFLFVGHPATVRNGSGLMSGLASLLIDSSIQRTLSSFAKRHAWAFSQGALLAPLALVSPLGGPAR